MLRSVLVFVCITLAGLSARAEGDTDAFQSWQALNQNTINAYTSGDLDAALTAAQIALDYAKTHLRDSPSGLGESHNNVAQILKDLGNIDDARDQHMQALDVALAQDPPNFEIAAATQQLIAKIDMDHGENRTAAAGYRKAIEYNDAGGFDPFFALRSLAVVIDRLADPTQEEVNEALDALMRQLPLFHAERQAQYPGLFGHDFRLAIHFASLTDRLTEMRPFTEALMSLRSSADPVDPAALGEAQGLHARVLVAEGDLAAAEDMFKQAIEMLRVPNEGITPEMARVSSYYGNILKSQGRYADAERAWLRVLDVERQLYGDADQRTVTSYFNIGNLMILNKKPGAAESLLRRGLALSEDVFGPEHGQTADFADNLGVVLSALGDHDEAITLLRRALVIQQKNFASSEAFFTATMNNLAMVLDQAGQTEESLAIHKDVLKIRQRTLAPDDIGLAVTLEHLADGVAEQGTIAAYTEAYDYLKQSLDVSRGVYPSQHEQLANILVQLGLSARQLGLHDEAADHLREAAAIQSAPNNRALVSFYSSTFDSAATAVLSLPGDHAAEAFELAQWPMQTAASKAIAASAQRAASGDPSLARLLRQKQDLEAQHTRLNTQLLASLGATDEGDPASLNDALTDTTAELARIASDMAAQFPDFTQFQAGVPASVAEVAAVLAPDEALVFLRPGHERYTDEALPGAVFVVRSDGRVAAAPLEPGYSLYYDARTLLCSVHSGTSSCPDVSAASGLTRGAFSPSDLSDDEPDTRWYNLDLAHDLFLRMFGDVEDDLRDAKRLIIVPGDEALASLPFQMLLSRPMPDGLDDETEAYRTAPWMIRDWALTVLPNVSALTHARRDQRQTTAQERRFLGVGDPVIGSAAAIDCTDDTAPLHLAALDRSVQSTETATLWHSTETNGAIADVDAVRRLTRLPDTRCELERIAASLGGGTLLMEDMANETRLKTMSENGDLARYDVISFATHGLIAGEIDNAEPALVLTPPAQGTTRDDGLLTAGEIAQLNLNAEWVLLSACNTAAGRVTGGDGVARAESFSGLARAFFYAGARNLLVSHWPVQSPAAVRLTTVTFDKMEENPDLDRARAFQLSMLAILDDPNATAATLHPRYWAPFTLLGGEP